MSVILAHRVYGRKNRFGQPDPRGSTSSDEDRRTAQPNSVVAPQILHCLGDSCPMRTLQYRLKHLVTLHRLVMDGEGRWAKIPELPDSASTRRRGTIPTNLSCRSLNRGQRSATSRVSGNCGLASRSATIAGSRPLSPNASFYLTKRDRMHLATVGRPQIAEQPAGTYAKQHPQQGCDRSCLNSAASKATPTHSSTPSASLSWAKRPRAARILKRR